MPDPTQEKATRPTRMISDETILKVSKEIAIKFIETGRITPATFGTTFPEIYATVQKTARE